MPRTVNGTGQLSCVTDHAFPEVGSAARRPSSKQSNVRCDRDDRVSPTGCGASYPERGMRVAKGRLEDVLPWEL